MNPTHKDIMAFAKCLADYVEKCERLQGIVDEFVSIYAGIGEVDDTTHLALFRLWLKAVGKPTDKNEQSDLTIWVVQYGNYDPPEIDTCWTTEALAQQRAAQLGGMWEVSALTVYASWQNIEA